ncbi:hypothetical protein GCM10010251_61720 [Streptomyces aurantiogriseus]|uniref:Transposase n=1 Tax=Streptomyces aurantiogriseus TaxID=66870 RepID=A0A918FGV8_9ACTN|nr:hypothetical protein GCM10010251_61720 [Streptomyces aurantiogriseus]
MTTTATAAVCASGASPRKSPGADNRLLGLGRVRWVAESAIAWLHGARRWRTRWETRDDMHDTFLQLAHCMTLARKVPAF